MKVLFLLLALLAFSLARPQIQFPGKVLHAFEEILRKILNNKINSSNLHRAEFVYE